MKSLIPLALILLGLWLLVGCFTVPVFEHPTGPSAGVDFRKLVGDRGLNTMIHVGVTRAQVVALLGEPEETLDHGRQAWYGFSTVRSGWVILPLCFNERWGKVRSYRLSLTYDVRDILQAWDINYVDRDYKFNDDVGTISERHETRRSAAPTPRAASLTSHPATAP